MKSPLGRFLTLNCIAAVILYLSIKKFFLGLPLVTSTDVVGYPVHQNYNINDVFLSYFYFPLLVPFLALGIGYCWTSFSRFCPPKWRTRAIQFAQKGTLRLVSKKAWIFSEVKRAAVGFALSLIFISPNLPLSGHFFVQRFLFVGLYLLLLHGAIRTIQGLSLKKKYRGSEALSWVNSLFVPFTVLPLWVASQSTRILETGPNEIKQVVNFPWIHPLFMVFLFTCVAAFVATRLRTARQTRRWAEIETQLVLIVPISIILFMWRSSVPGGFVGLDLYHAGETLASARAFERGYFPWRDLLFIHGLLEDPWKSLIGMKLIENTMWGASAAFFLVILPFYWVLSYLMVLGLFGPLYSLIFAFLLPCALPQFFDNFHFRFFLNPLIILFFYWSLKERKAWRIFLFSFFLLFESLITPEAMFNLPAFGLALLASEIYNWDKKKKLWTNLKFTLGVSAWCSLFLGAWFFYLASEGALKDYFYFFINFASDHRFTGGLKPQWNPGKILDTFRLVAFTPWLLMWFTFWYFVTSYVKQKKLEELDWVMLALSFFTLLYYQKGISRFDGHIYHPFWAAVPLMFIQGYRVLQWAEKRFQESEQGKWIYKNVTHHPVTWCFALGLYALNPFQIPTSLSQIPKNFEKSATRNPTWPLAGYLTLPADVNQQGKNLKKVFDAYLQPEDRIFDFTNHPALFFFILDRLPATRFFHVSMAMHRKAQALLIDELQKEQPKLIVFFSPGFSSWDGVPNMVRHYDVSQFVLDHYTPFITVEGYQILKRRDLQFQPPNKMGLVFETKPYTQKMDETLPSTAETCSWGFVPVFWSDHLHETAPGSPQKLEFTPRVIQQAMREGQTEKEYITEIELPTDFSGTHFLDIQFKKLSPSSFTLTDRSTYKNGPNADTDPIKRNITFQSMPGANIRYRIQVGSCMQWYSYQKAHTRQLYLQYQGEQEIESIELRK